MELYTMSTLEKAFNFTDQDVRENRQGTLSAAQAARLRAQARRTLFLVLGALAAITIPSILIVGSSANELVVVLSCVLLPIAGVTFAFTVAPTEAAVAPKVVSKVSGQAHKAFGLSPYDPPISMAEAGRIHVSRAFILGFQGSYRVIVGDREFRLGKEEYEAMAPGYYTVYFVPTINKIVSVARMDAEAEMEAIPSKPEVVITVAPSRDDAEEVKG